MPDFNKPIPAYLTVKKNIVQLILLTAAFSLAFINIYEPFGVNVWFKITRWQLLIYSSLITLTGVLIVVISRIIMYYRCRNNRINYWSYFLWVLAEVFFMALFYSVYIKYFLHDLRSLPDLVKLTIQNTALLLLLPYSVLWLYFSWKEKKLELAEIAEGQAPADNARLLVPFNDEKGVMRFSVKMENLVYIEAADNYVNIHYLNQGKMARFLLRNSLKNLEDELKGTDVVRCHRKFMVNCDKVRVIRREKDGVSLEMDIPETMNIPVTKTYMESIMQAFTGFSRNA